MLACLKSYEDWYPEGARILNESIEQHLAEEADVDIPTFQSAKSIIWWDGNYGPHTDEDYAGEGHTITKAKAMEIIEAARGYQFSDVEFDNPDLDPVCDCGSVDPESDDNCIECCTHTNCTISGKSIYDEVWKWYREIYG